jgi:ATP-dependent Clp protease ATP-binding subunit ClpB
VFGARPLKRTLQHEILDPLAMKIIEGAVQDEQAVTVDAKGEAVTLRVGK